MQPSIASKFDMCLSCFNQIPIGQPVFIRDNREVCEACSVLYDKREALVTVLVTSKVKKRKPRARTSKKVA